MQTRMEKIKDMRMTHAKQAAKSPAAKSPAAKGTAVKGPAVNKKLAAALAAIAKKYGAEALTSVVGGRSLTVEGIRTEWPIMDDLLTGETDAANHTVPGSGIGLPRGRIIEVYGPEACGKTTLCLHFIKAVQAAGGVAAYLDAEHALDTKYAHNLGVDLSSLLISQPDSAEQALDIAVDLAKSGTVDLIIIDSVAALTPEDEDENSVGKSQMALQARLMSKGLRKLTPHVAKNNCIMLFVNQIRMKIGVMFGNPETTSGGNALKFYASVRLDIRRVKTLKKGDKAIGIRSRLRTVKNKVAPPFRDLHLDIYPNKGICVIHGDPDVGGEE